MASKTPKPPQLYLEVSTDEGCANPSETHAAVVFIPLKAAQFIFERADYPYIRFGPTNPAVEKELRYKNCGPIFPDGLIVPRENVTAEATALMSDTIEVTGPRDLIPRASEMSLWLIVGSDPDCPGEHNTCELWPIEKWVEQPDGSWRFSDKELKDLECKDTPWFVNGPRTAQQQMEMEEYMKTLTD